MIVSIINIMLSGGNRVSEVWPIQFCVGPRHGIEPCVLISPGARRRTHCTTQCLILHERMELRFEQLRRTTSDHETGDSILHDFLVSAYVGGDDREPRSGSFQKRERIPFRCRCHQEDVKESEQIRDITSVAKKSYLSGNTQLLGKGLQLGA